MRDRHVYIARCLGPTGSPIGAIKVGCSYGWADRIISVGRNQPFKLELIVRVPGHLVMERACHLYLRRHRIDGEYFHENSAVMEFVDRAAGRGFAFYYFSDDGFDHLPTKAVQGLLDYHRLPLAEVCKELGVPLKKYEGKLDGKHNSNVIATAGLLLNARGRYVNWPGDALRGLIGEVHPHAAVNIEAAA